MVAKSSSSTSSLTTTRRHVFFALILLPIVWNHLFFAIFSSHRTSLGIRCCDDYAVAPPPKEHIATREPRDINHDGEILGSPSSTVITFGNNCTCELMSIDCLDTIRCLTYSNIYEFKKIQEGVVKRRVLQSTSKSWDTSLTDDYDWAPVGKTLQSVTTRLWRVWLTRNELPLGFFSRNESFYNETIYPYCLLHGFKGRACFIGNFKSSEEFGEMEMEAIRLHGLGTAIETKQAKEDLVKLRDSPNDVTPYFYLLHLSHMSRIAFNIRPFVLRMYEQRLKVIRSKVAVTSQVLRVSLHVRRGDACAHALSGYSKKHSPLSSKAQWSGSRLCYDTSVYMKVLSRIQSRAKGKHLEVYVSTDHLGSLLDEIKAYDRKLFDSMTWKYVHYPRDVFNYSETLLEGEHYIEWAPNMPELGETAFLDIWHLSHGQIFVGHLGSRFGKLSWWQATARHNSFVPYFTVDGHSVCCEIDEACGANAQAVVSMENCLTFSREDGTYKQDPEKYWIDGSTVRFQAADAELIYRKKILERKKVSKTKT
jgi:hypothetical protein